MGDRPPHRPDPLADRVMRGPLGRPLSVAAARIDGPAFWALRRWFFPLSRLWAAAEAADGDVGRFATEAGLDLSGPLSRRLARRALAHHQATRAAATAAERAWMALAFPAADAGPPSGSAETDRLAAAEARFRAAGGAHVASRISFYPLLWGRSVAPLRWDILPPAALDARHGALLADPAAAFALPDPLDAALDAVEESRPARRGETITRWVRFPSPGGDTGWGRITDSDTPGAATVILATGVCLEPERMASLYGLGRLLARRGLRVIELLSPHHGLRLQPGRYAGERFFATGPLGGLEQMSTLARDIGLLTAWARRRHAAPVGVAGVSMGALGCQQAISRCAGWPAGARADAALLVAHSGRLDRSAVDGILPRRFGMAQALAAAGWQADDLARWAPLLNPAPDPAIAPARIISVLGRRDRLTRFDDGQALVRHWRLPADNRFAFPHGHLGLAVPLLRDPRPIDRLQRLLHGG